MDIYSVCILAPVFFNLRANMSFRTLLSSNSVLLLALSYVLPQSCVQALGESNEAQDIV